MTHSPSKVRLLVGFGTYLVSCALVASLVLVLPESRWLRAGLVAGALVAAATFLVIYHVGTRGYWRRSDIGVHLMSFALADAIVLSYVLLAFLGWLPLTAAVVLSAITYLTLAWLFVWRTVITVRYLRRPEMSDPVPVPEPDPDAEDYRDGWPPKT